MTKFNWFSINSKDKWPVLRGQNGDVAVPMNGDRAYIDYVLDDISKCVAASEDDGPYDDAYIYVFLDKGLGRSGVLVDSEQKELLPENDWFKQ